MSSSVHSKLKPEPEHKYENKTRQCLMCRESFISEWPGERICSKCKQKANWRTGSDTPLGVGH